MKHGDKILEIKIITKVSQDRHFFYGGKEDSSGW